MLPLLDSHQNRLCREEDDEELAGRGGSCKESLHLCALYQIMGGEEEKNKRERRESPLFCYRQWNGRVKQERVLVGGAFNIVGGN